MKEKFNLGERVICDGYLKKTGYCIMFDEIGKNEVVESTNDPKYEKEFYEGDPVEVKKLELKKFHGYICGKQNVATHISYWEDECEYWCRRGITKDKIVPCYEVCVENKNRSWGKRLVPMAYVHKETAE